MGGEERDWESYTRFAVTRWDARDDKTIALRQATVIDLIQSTQPPTPHLPLSSHYSPTFFSYSLTQTWWTGAGERWAAGLVPTGRGNTFGKIKSGWSKVKPACLSVEQQMVSLRHRWLRIQCSSKWKCCDITSPSFKVKDSMICSNISEFQTAALINQFDWILLTALTL